MKCRDSNIRAMITPGVAELQRHGPREAVGGDGRAAFVLSNHVWSKASPSNRWLGP